MSDINSTQSMWGHPNTALTMNDLFTIHPNLCWYANRCPGKCVTGVGLRWRVVSEMTGWLGSSVVTCPHGQRKALGRATFCHLLQMAPNINNPLWRGGSVVECSHGQRKTLGRLTSTFLYSTLLPAFQNLSSDGFQTSQSNHVKGANVIF